jgi:hypothetical protein
VLDDIMLKKALRSQFKAKPDSYLETIYNTVQDSFSDCLPESLIPREHYVYSSAPLKHGLNASSGNAGEDADVEYNPETRSWDKVIFPTSKPTRRVEIYLLAKTLDDMIDELKSLDWSPRVCVLLRMRLMRKA